MKILVVSVGMIAIGLLVWRLMISQGNATPPEDD
jgi:hypothetical protein|tara:strand:+ start:175 stop:276 length:102 start_codon:yes stop_codon:yes gene_type:complete